MADFEKIDIEIPEKQKNIPTYWAFALVAIVVNPPLGLLALFFSWECRRCQKNGWKNARRYSDFTFGLSVLAIVATILILVFVYAEGHFPDDDYYCRDDIIDGKKGDDIRHDPKCKTTRAPQPAVPTSTTLAPDGGTDTSTTPAPNIGR